jgi:hypothetical protein
MEGLCMQCSRTVVRSSETECYLLWDADAAFRHFCLSDLLDLVVFLILNKNRIVELIRRRESAANVLLFLRVPMCRWLEAFDSRDETDSAAEPNAAERFGQIC